MRRRRPKHEFVDAHRDGRFWWACDHPERPFDPWVCWLWECDFCLAAALTEAKYRPHQFTLNVDRTTAAADYVETDIEHALAEAQRWRKEQGLDP